MKSFAVVIVSAVLLIMTTHDPCQARNGLRSRVWRCRPTYYAPTAVARPPVCALTVQPSEVCSQIISEPTPSMVSAANGEFCQELPAPVGVLEVADVDQPSELNLMMTAEIVDLRRRLEELKLAQSEKDSAIAEAKQLVNERGKELDEKAAEFVKATQRAEQAETALADAKKETQAVVAAHKELQTSMQQAAKDSDASIVNLKAEHDAAMAEAKKKSDAELKKAGEELAAAKSQAVKATSQAMQEKLQALEKELATTKEQLEKAKQQVAEKNAAEKPAEEPAKDADQPAKSLDGNPDVDDSSDAGEKDSAE